MIMSSTVADGFWTKDKVPLSPTASGDERLSTSSSPSSPPLCQYACSAHSPTPPVHRIPHRRWHIIGIDYYESLGMYHHSRQSQPCLNSTPCRRSIVTQRVAHIGSTLRQGRVFGRNQMVRTLICLTWHSAFILVYRIEDTVRGTLLK